MASETAQTRRNAAARPRTTRARRSGRQPSRRPRRAAATSTQAIAASASVTSIEVEPTPSETLGWYVAWRKRNGTAAARTSASDAASPTKARTIPAGGCARGSGSAVTRRTVARATAAPYTGPPRWLRASSGAGLRPQPGSISRSPSASSARSPPRGFSASSDFGRFATVMAVVGLAQTLLDLTVEESLTKFGFRYVAGGGLGEAPPALSPRARAQARGRRARDRS